MNLKGTLIKFPASSCYYVNDKGLQEFPKKEESKYQNVINKMVDYVIKENEEEYTKALKSGIAKVSVDEGNNIKIQHIPDLNTIKEEWINDCVVSGWKLLKAMLFGKKILTPELDAIDGNDTVCYYYKNKFYFCNQITWRNIKQKVKSLRKLKAPKQGTNTSQDPS